MSEETLSAHLHRSFGNYIRDSHATILCGTAGNPADRHNIRPHIGDIPARRATLPDVECGIQVPVETHAALQTLKDPVLQGQ